MAITKIGKLIGRINCPNCFSALEWDDINDVHISNGNKYVICPECNQNIILDSEKDYWINKITNDEEEETQEEDSESGVKRIVFIPYQSPYFNAELSSFSSASEFYNYCMENPSLDNLEIYYNGDLTYSMNSAIDMWKDDFHNRFEFFEQGNSFYFYVYSDRVEF